MSALRWICVSLLTLGAVGTCRQAYGTIVGPYTVDADTLHLWHLDEPSAGFAGYGDASGVATPITLTSLGSAGNAATQVGVSSYSAAFNNAFQSVQTVETGIYAKTPAANTTDNTSFASFTGANGAFTYEEMVRFDDASPPVGGVQLISADGESGSPTDRAFQFVLDNQGASGIRLEFENIPGGEGAATGLFSSNISVLPNTWYHVAVTYNGAENTANNLTFYWTQMLPGTTTATSVGSVVMVHDVTSANSDFAIGAEARSSGGDTGQWNGAIDEVRISDIARGPDQMMFGVPEPSSLALALLCGIMSLACGSRSLAKRSLRWN